MNRTMGGFARGKKGRTPTEVVCLQSRVRNGEKHIV